MQNINNQYLITYNPQAFFSQANPSNLTEKELETKEIFENAIESHKKLIENMNFLFMYQ